MPLGKFSKTLNHMVSVSSQLSLAWLYARWFLCIFWYHSLYFLDFYLKCCFMLFPSSAPSFSSPPRHLRIPCSDPGLMSGEQDCCSGWGRGGAGAEAAQRRRGRASLLSQGGDVGTRYWAWSPDPTCLPRAPHLQSSEKCRGSHPGGLLPADVLIQGRRAFSVRAGGEYFLLCRPRRSLRPCPRSANGAQSRCSRHVRDARAPAQGALPAEPTAATLAREPH